MAQTPKNSPSQNDSAKTGADNGKERIAKAMARVGIASRRDAEKMIIAGRVSVNGKQISSPALDVGPKDKVVVDGKPIDAKQPVRMWLYYKPLGLVVSEKDEKGRQTVFDTMPEGMPRVMSVGRLDLNSEGLLLLTNDGELKRRLELPETGWLRRYRVRVNGAPNELTFDPLRRGATIEGEDFQPMEIQLDRQKGANAWLTVGLREGRNREIRRAMAHVGLTVNRLIRVSYGPFRLNEMKPGDITEIRSRVMRDQLGALMPQDPDSEAARPERINREDDNRRFGKRPPRPEEMEGDRRDFGRDSGRDFGREDRREGGFQRRSFGRDGDQRGDQRGQDRGQEGGSYGDRPQRGNSGPRRFGEDRGRDGGRDGDQRDSRGFRDGGRDGGRDGAKGGFRSSGFRSHGGAEGGRASGFKSHGARPGGDRDGERGGERGGDRGRAGGFKSHGKSFGDKPYGSKPSGGDREDRGPRRPRHGSAAAEGGEQRARGPAYSRDGDRGGERGNDRGGPRQGGFKSGGFKSGGFKSDGPRSDRPRSDRPRSEGSRSDGPRSGGYKSDGFKSDRPRSGGFKPGGGFKSGGERGEGGGRPAGKFGGPKSGGFKSGGPKAGGFKSGGPRDGGPRSGGPRSSGPRSSGPRRDG